jgi:hypothetical protein
MFKSDVRVALVAALVFPAVSRAATKDEWITLGARIHGAFGPFIPVGIRIGLDAMDKQIRSHFRSAPGHGKHINLAPRCCLRHPLEISAFLVNLKKAQHPYRTPRLYAGFRSPRRGGHDRGDLARIGVLKPPTELRTLGLGPLRPGIQGGSNSANTPSI